MEELIDVLDEDGKKTGIVKPKSLIKHDGDYHRAISICFMNLNNEILLQKRSGKKIIYPNLWSMFLKGHVRSGEDSISSAIRETKEELNLKIDARELLYLYTIKEEKIKTNYIEKIFFDTYLVLKNINFDSIILNDEVSDVIYINYQELKEMILNRDIRLIPNILDYEKIIPILDSVIIEKGKSLNKNICE